MDESKSPIFSQEIFSAVRKCRSGDISKDVAQILDSAKLLRGVMHVEAPTKIRIVFARALRRRELALAAERHIGDQLPRQASFRIANAFGVDFIISGQLPESWADEQLAKRSDLFEDVYEAVVISNLRYRWGTPKRRSTSRSQAKLDPSVDDVEKFLSDPKQATRLVYNSSGLPSLSCLALITTDGKDWEDIWDDLDVDEQKPVRDVFTNLGNRVNLAATMERDAIQLVSDYAFCEFDSIPPPERNGTFIPAMNQAHNWRKRLIEKNGIQQVRLIPCAVITESIDYYDELDESKDRMKLFNRTVRLPYATPQTGASEDDIPFPIWNVAICGGPGSGKSVFAYVLASALLKEHKYDVVYVNYKNSDDTETVGPQPRNEALEFAKVIEHIAREGINLVLPEDIETTMIREEKPSAFYTECARGIRAEYVLDAILKAHEKEPKKHKTGKFVFFDEILNQKDNRKVDMKSLQTFVNQARTSNIYLGIIHQDLAEFWEDDSASVLIEKSTVILGSSLSGKDEDGYDLLLKRAEKKPPPNYPVTFAEVRRYQKREGQFVFLPIQEGDSEQPVRHRLPQYSFLKSPGSIPEEWKWGTKTTVRSS